MNKPEGVEMLLLAEQQTNEKMNWLEVAKEWEEYARQLEARIDDIAIILDDV